MALLNQELEKLVSDRTAELRAEVEMRQKAQEKLHRLAVTDGLTRLYNYRYFMDSCRKEFDRYKRYKRPLSLITIDVDLFKSVNDTFGHEAGDTALCALADIVRKSFRNVDITARIGGEELAILLPETTLERAFMAAERLRRNVAGATVKYHQHHISLTISAGVAACVDEISDFKELISRADSALYAAKKHGRNRVERYHRASIEAPISNRGSQGRPPHCISTSLYISKFSNTIPEPVTTVQRGSFATTTGRPVSRRISSSKFFNRAPPPVSTIPRSTISDANSAAFVQRSFDGFENRLYRLGDGFGHLGRVQNDDLGMPVMRSLPFTSS